MRTYKLFHPGKDFCKAPVLSNPAAHFMRASADMASVYRDLYREIAREWKWGRALHWDISQWRQHLDAPGVDAAILMVDAQPAGWFELRMDPSSRSVEIYYLALRNAFLGQGLGRPLLRQAILAAYLHRPGRLWLKTSSEDHPCALPLYISGNFHFMAIEDRHP